MVNGDEESPTRMFAAAWQAATGVVAEWAEQTAAVARESLHKLTTDPAVRAASQELANADFTETGRETGQDHSAHVAGKTCASCGEPISAAHPARRRGESDWVHDVCPRTD